MKNIRRIVCLVISLGMLCAIPLPLATAHEEGSCPLGTSNCVEHMYYTVSRKTVTEYSNSHCYNGSTCFRTVVADIAEHSCMTNDTPPKYIYTQVITGIHSAGPWNCPSE